MSFDFTQPDDLRRAANTSASGADGIHCPRCAGQRRVSVNCVLGAPPRSLGSPTYAGPRTPNVTLLTCLQCSARATAVIYDGPSGEEVAIHWNQAGGLASPNTPASVSYYLDQAARSDGTGARSAAASMYRGALEQLLYEQGYKTGMLNAKIQKVKDDIAANTAKAWARDLAPDFMEVLKSLGNGAIHPNDGDIAKQEAFDRDLISDVRVAMEALLDLVYEKPKRDADRLARLQAGADKVKK